jgi:diguanylate cyclase (GGDEF)-like protein
VARTAVEPLLSGHPLSDGVAPSERAGLLRLTAHVIGRGDVLRLRVRSLTGRVVVSDDRSGLADKPDDEALDAAGGRTVALLTRLNADANDTGRRGVAAVEVYLPLDAGRANHRVGVLEIYLPYAPISREVASGLHRLYLELGAGLSVLYLVLFAITASVSAALRRESERNVFLAEHDVLTELPNRGLFHRRAVNAVRSATTTRRAAAIAIVDLDRFKDINDTLGHSTGDSLLTEIARRLAATMRPGDTVARLGGDEFGIIVRGVEDAEPVLWRLREVIDREIEIRGLPLSVQASIGFVSVPEDGTAVDELLQRAEVAMYAAKARHVGVVRYDTAFDNYDAARLTLVSELRHAIEQDQLVLHYQPQASFASGQVRSVEALVRWQHPTLGLLYPDAFLPLAEQTDLIDRLTSWVLRSALRDVRRLAEADPSLRVAINVSARTIGRESFAAEVIEQLAEHGVPGHRLIVEVTETALLADPARAAGVLGALAEAGVGTSLDDFGQGHTSLGYLSKLPLDELKIDKGFVLDMLENEAHAAIVRSIIDLGHNLALEVVAEGIETIEHHDRLRDIGCDVAQGYLLARPMPFVALQAWLGSPMTLPEVPFT